MAIQILRRLSGAAGAPASLRAGQLAFNHVDGILYYGDGDDGSGAATAIVKIGGAGAFVLATLLGAVNGVATLDATGKLPASQLTAAVSGALNYQGTWNASSNSPALASGAGTKGFMYKVAVAGTTALDGHATWNVGDVAVFNGATWDKLDGIDSEVLSVAGRTGAVTLTTGDLTDMTTVGRALAQAASVSAARLALGIEGLTGVADANYTVLATDQRVEVASITASRTITLPAANAVAAGRRIVIGDMSGALSTSVTLTVSRASASDTITGLSSITLSAPYAQLELMSDGSTKWAVVARAIAATIDDGSF